MNGDSSIKVTDSRVCESCKEKNWCKKDCDSYKFELGTEEIESYLSDLNGEIIAVHKNLKPVVVGYCNGIEHLGDVAAIRIANAHTYDGKIKKLEENYMMSITEDVIDISVGKEAVGDELRKRIPKPNEFINTIAETGRE